MKLKTTIIAMLWCIIAASSSTIFSTSFKQFVTQLCSPLTPSQVAPQKVTEAPSDLKQFLFTLAALECVMQGKIAINGTHQSHFSLNKKKDYVIRIEPLTNDISKYNSFKNSDFKEFINNIEARKKQYMTTHYKNETLPSNDVTFMLDKETKCSFVGPDSSTIIFELNNAKNFTHNIAKIADQLNKDPDLIERRKLKQMDSSYECKD